MGDLFNTLNKSLPGRSSMPLEGQFLCCALSVLAIALYKNFPQNVLVFSSFWSPRKRRHGGHLISQGGGAFWPYIISIIRLPFCQFNKKVVLRLSQGWRKPFQRPRQDPFSAPLIVYDVMRSTVQDLFAKLPTSCVVNASADIPLGLSQGPQNLGSKDNFQHFCKQVYLYFCFGSTHVFVLCR